MLGRADENGEYAFGSLELLKQKLIAYLDANPEGHAGETREQRIEEYIEANPRRYVVGLREGCMLRVEGEKMELIGKRPMRVFKRNQPIVELNAGDDLSFLM